MSLRDSQFKAVMLCWQYGIDFSQNLKVALEKLVDGAGSQFVVEPEKIKVPFLVMAGENELDKEGIRQAREFYDRLGSKIKEKRIITEVEGGEAHCQLYNFPLARQTMFDWKETV